MVVAMISASCPPMRQSSFDLINPPVPSRSSRVGLASLPASVSDGPMARTITFFGCVPSNDEAANQDIVASINRKSRGDIGQGWTWAIGN